MPRGNQEETEMAKVLPGFVPGCKLGRPRIESVTRRHRARLPSAWKGRLLRNGGPRNVPEVLRLLRTLRWPQPSSVRAAHHVS
jgi:hypothetical protein